MTSRAPAHPLQPRGWAACALQPAPKPSREPDAAFRLGNDAPNRVPNFCDELSAKPCDMLFVEPSSGNEFFLRLRAENGTSHRSAARALRKTAAAGLVSTFPVRSSATRRWASFAHRAALPAARPPPPPAPLSF